jgi:hypothetical protein
MSRTIGGHVNIRKARHFTHSEIAEIVASQKLPNFSDRRDVDALLAQKAVEGMQIPVKITFHAEPDALGSVIVVYDAPAEAKGS